MFYFYDSCLTFKYFVYLCSPIKSALLFGAMGFFLEKTDRFEADEPRIPEQPFGCEDFEVKDNEKYQEIFKKKLSNTF